MHIRMLIKRQSEVCLHTRHRVHFQFSPFTRLSFWGSDFETTFWWAQNTVHINAESNTMVHLTKRCDSLTGYCTMKDGHSHQHKDPTKTMEDNGSWTSCDGLLNCFYQAFVLQCVPLFCPLPGRCPFHIADHFQYAHANTDRDGTKSVLLARLATTKFVY